MHRATFKKLHAEGLISDASLQQMEVFENNRLFSLFWELRTLLYLGVLLLTGGLGILVYKNIDTIGHQAVLAFIAAVTAGCFFYCWRKKTPFNWRYVSAPTPFFDYILLLGCLSLLIFLGYLQYAYDVFGDNYGLATFVPMVILFATAYLFDHIGVLSLAITNLAAWAGIAITPLTILKAGNFGDPHLLFTGLLLGAVLVAAGRLTELRRLKAHFSPVYFNFGGHLFFIAALTRLFEFHKLWFLWFLGLTGAAFFFYIQAMVRRNFYYVVVLILYAYIALCGVVIRSMDLANNDAFGLLCLYFIGSAIGIIFLLIHINRKLNAHDRV
ncbi:MAG TPA: DUF2157 domain-containing protein [Puia sp.]|uniref:DUF2157 domain-containing protein n=1 Tax=Puia sp. TaxID=2045100 RepID=UPI002C502D9E|nr:DUF2157 domain-containing protein [Puia sp.]HVU96927.1 DUF2157 domain-containing protein [Puia sp.]